LPGRRERETHIIHTEKEEIGRDRVEKGKETERTRERERERENQRKREIHIHIHTLPIQ